MLGSNQRPQLVEILPLFPESAFAAFGPRVGHAPIIPSMSEDADTTNAIAEELRQISSELAALRDELAELTNSARALHEIRDALAQNQSDDYPRER